MDLLKRSPVPGFDDEANLRRALRRNRALATGLLVAAAAVFLGTSALGAAGFWVGLVRAGAEAALVGGLADWFAVTALFRHPFGLPMPRTAIIPNHKDRIGAGLGLFVERNFLAPDILAAKLAALAPVRHASLWLAAPEHARAVATRLAAALPPLLRSLEDRELRTFILRTFHDQLRELELAPALGRIVALLTRSGQYDALFDRALDAAHDALARNADRLYAMVAERSRWWVPRAIDRRIAETIIGGIEDILAELRKPDSEARAQFRAGVETMAAQLVASPSWRQRVAEIKDRLLEQNEVQAWLGGVWDELRGIVLEDLEAPSSRTREALAQGLLSLGRTLAADAEMQRRLHGGLEHLVLAVVPWRGQIAALIAEVVRSWDADTVTERLELALGSDLQYIRMSGTLVGASVGCVLFLIARFAWPGG
ncbi:MAG TPA: DUF445 domain-containing protein [Stellaceae bacterium]|nr:DUF445 domain-containing protein [Stellaceae bacterium]